MTGRPTYKIAFVNEASSLIGMGHILRSQVLARIMFARGYTISGFTIGDKNAVSYAEEQMKHENFKWSIRVMQDTQAAIDDIVHIPPHLVVIDCSKASRDIVIACKAFGIRILALDYFSYEQPLPDAIINLIDHSAVSLSGQSLIREGLVYHEGPQYAIIRDEFILARNYRISKSELALPKKILIAFGGADPSGNSKRALNILLNWPGEFLVDLIIGPLFKLEVESITASVSHKFKITIHKSPSYISKLFEAADLVFCGGGGTLLEAIYVGIPAIVIAQNESELRHAKSLAQRQACWMLEDVDWEIVSSTDNRNKRSKYSRACVDGLGAERICDVIEQQLNKI